MKIEVEIKEKKSKEYKKLLNFLVQNDIDFVEKTDDNKEIKTPQRRSDWDLDIN
jgi:hypothetical protein